MTRHVLCVLIVTFVGATWVPAADNPSRENLSGKWQWTSYLLDPTSVIAAQKGALPTSIATIWAKGDLELRDIPVAGERDTLQGTLTFPSGVQLDVRGRRVTGEGDAEEFVFQGTTSKPIKMVYEIRGTSSAPWYKDGDTLNLRGYIRNVEGDPIAPGGVGAFVLIRK